MVMPCTPSRCMRALCAALALTAAAPSAFAQEATMGGIVEGTYQVYPVRGKSAPKGPAGPAADCAVNGAAACDPQVGREWEGLASTDYYTTAGRHPPSAEIAVGPDDILTISALTIARYPNPNAQRFDNGGGTAPVPYVPAGTLRLPPTSRIDLDTWLGEAALHDLCPTMPRSPQSCVIGNASVRYDQMQGRFLVLFTVVDTGHVATAGLASPSTADGSALRRKATWVLVVSRWATACQGSIAVSGINVGGTCATGTGDADVGETGNAQFFSTPQPPGPNQANPSSGGANANWIVYSGSADGSCEASCQFGNVNSISDLRRGLVAPVGARTIDCRNIAVGDATRVCYLPTSARLGLDNDNILIVSSVIDDNVPLSIRGAAPKLTPAYEGTRIRVLKKAAIYTGLTSTPGASAITPGASQAIPQLQGDFYDLFAAGSGYTIDRTLVGLHYEPAHVRGRPLASFTGNGLAANGFASLVGAVGAAPGGPPQTALRVQHVRYSATTFVAPSGGVTRPLLSGGIPTLAPTLTTTVQPFTNPTHVRQRLKLTQPSPNNVLPTPDLYVGDNRPLRLLMREGYLHVARVAQLPNTFNLDGVAQPSTVVYDGLQTFTSASAPLPIFNLFWQNGRFFAPMFDVPSYSTQAGGTSPLLALPLKSVGTTFPPLPPNDASLFSYGNAFGQALVACKGNEPTATTSVSAYPGLFDIRCGEDAYDSFQAVQHPGSGSLTPADFQLPSQPSGLPNQLVPFAFRGGAATDPITLGSWTYGAYAKARQARSSGHGQWGTFVAHYPAVVPTHDLGGQPVAEYSDVPRSHPLFTSIQIGRLMRIDADTPSTTFSPAAPVTRLDMARWTIRSLMDENAITAYLNSTGGIACAFGDIPCPGSSGTVTNLTGISGGWRYVESMFRLGITSGCQASPTRLFCPSNTLTRGEMAVFLMRAKMLSVFPMAAGGAVATTACVPPGQSTTTLSNVFGLAQGCNPYFSDVPNTHPFFAHIQKLRELRITAGTTLGDATTLATYRPNDTLTRQQLMVFVVRAFFP